MPTERLWRQAGVPTTEGSVSDRGVAPVIGTVLLVAIVVVAGALVGGVTLGVSAPEAGPQASIDATVDPATDRVMLVHEGGESLDVEALSVQVTIDGEQLDRQPPVPFFSAAGFRPGPTGPFNAAADPAWKAGERASFRIAATNDPTIDPGDSVTIRIYEADVPIAEVSVTA